ncbi:MAG: NAD(P)H-dependent oxidoreductase [Oligoflexia bacterium]|nr:MAG: NAD(P)H-dependent oxidoreductase [Oligoflexia bacterium]
MKTIDTQMLLTQLNWRYATKKFDATKKIPQDQWEALEEVLRLSPSSYGTQPWKFLIVQDQEVRKKLTPVTWNQAQVESCSHYVVITTLRKVTPEYLHKYIQRVAEVRGSTLEQLQGFEAMLNKDLVQGPRSQTIAHWAQRQAYIAMGNLMNAAAFMGIDTCPLEGLEAEKYNEILGLQNSDYQVVAAVACGYRSADDKYSQIKKVRFEKKDVIEHI